MKKSYISQTDLTKYGFQLFLLGMDFKEDNMATAEELDGYIEEFETSKFKNHYDKIKDKEKKTYKKERKRVKQKVKKIRGKYE